MNVLVLCDDYWHPAITVRRGLEPLRDAGFEFDLIGHACQWDAARLDACPVVVFAKANDVSATDRTPWATDAVQQALTDYVQRGGGLLIVHSGTAGYKEAEVLRRLFGGVFTHHPPTCPVTVEPQDGHPLTAGSGPFTLPDEHYFMELDDPDAEIFMRTRSAHGEQPGGWRRVQGEGRVCVLTPGHELEVWRHPSYQKLLKNALLWCAADDQPR